MHDANRDQIEQRIRRCVRLSDELEKLSDQLKSCEVYNAEDFDLNLHKFMGVASNRFQQTWNRRSNEIQGKYTASMRGVQTALQRQSENIQGKWDQLLQNTSIEAQEKLTDELADEIRVLAAERRNLYFGVAAFKILFHQINQMFDACRSDSRLGFLMMQRMSALSDSVTEFYTHGSHRSFDTFTTKVNAQEEVVSLLGDPAVANRFSLLVNDLSLGDKSLNLEKILADPLSTRAQLESELNRLEQSKKIIGDATTLKTEIDTYLMDNSKVYQGFWRHGREGLDSSGRWSYYTPATYQRILALKEKSKELGTLLTGSIDASSDMRINGIRAKIKFDQRAIEFENMQLGRFALRRAIYDVSKIQNPVINNSLSGTSHPTLNEVWDTSSQQKLIIGSGSNQQVATDDDDERLY